MAEALTKAGRYQIVSELGRGSMGVVYRGFDPIIGRMVAIKTMLPEGLSPQEFQEYKARFQQEAVATGILTHPNIITVYDFGEDNGVLYLAMELLDGKSLEKLVQEQTVLPIETILPIFDQVCSALDHAHQNQIVHRDIKPANIMILKNGLVKVTDFGIAKIMAMSMTQAGQILGTPNYMSPEQVKGRQIDGRADIFSLGVILYELVTGEKPFGGQNITTVIYKIINENPIAPRQLDASIPAGLSYIISKALAKKVEERYQTCRELADDLKNYKNLGGATTGDNTMIMSAPPFPAPVAASPPPPPPVAETPLAPPPAAHAVGEALIDSSLNDEVPAEILPRQSIPQVAWVLAAFLVLGVIGVLSYFFVFRSQVHRLGSIPVAQVVKNPQLPAAPDAQLTPPVTATKAPATAPRPAAAKPVGAPAATNVTEAPPKELTHARTATTKVGQLVVSANVNGAKISIDGQSEPSWLTPYTIPDVPAGTHNVVISMDGYEDFQQSVTVEGGQASNVAASLASPRAELNIVTDPPSVEVIIDGKSYGPSPVHATLAPGDHTYLVKLPGMPTYQNSVTLAAGQIITKRLSLGGAVTTGIVEVRTSPPGASVLADGSPVAGQTPTSFRLSVGSHKLVIALPGHPPTERQVTVSENATVPVNVDFTSH